MLINYLKTAIPTVLVLFMLIGICKAQSGVSSPYSRYGIGDINEQGLYSHLGMGGLALSLSSFENVNISNPASLAWLKPQSVLFEIGAETKSVKLETLDTSQTTYGTTIAYLAFGFPIKKWWGSSFGLRPFSTNNYNITDEATLTNIGSVDFNYEGKGGINEVFWSNGFKFGDLAVGINSSYLFGPLQKNKSEIFEDPNIFNYYNSELINVGGFNLKTGLQYKLVIDTLKKKELKNKITLSVGAVFDFKADLKARRKVIGVTFDEYVTSPFLILPKDTILNTKDTGTMILPSGFGAGFSIGIGNSWLIGFDYYSKNWSSFSSFDIKDSLFDYTKFILGLQYMPNSEARNSYFKTLRYRFGLHQENTFINVKGAQLIKSGISFGLGLPLKRIKSIVSLGIELGKRGATDNNLVKENYWRAGFGITLGDIWFVKRKYD